ncbi:MAG TPA: GNAT family N-acetyltransferase [Gaiellaceae bacterium]|nr:GNAT family N-acetyltransferase [Gaiellaceae bacterium]
MPALEIHPWSEEFRGEAARLLAARHARERAAEPLLPEVEDFAAHVPDGDGAVATRGGEAVAYLIASVGEERAEVGLAGVAASEPEAVRDLYAQLARAWPPRHQALVPVSEGALVDAFFRLAHGLQFMLAVRETEAAAPVDFGGSIRLSTPDDLAAVADFDRILWTVLEASPSFSGRDIEAQDFEGEWANLWNEPEFPLHVVAERDGRVVGHALLYDRPTGDLRVPERNIDLGHAATVADVRGSGAGLALTAHVLDWAHEQGFRSMTTDWRSVNLLASRFWPKRGWHPTHYRLYRAVP